MCNKDFYAICYSVKVGFGLFCNRNCYTQYVNSTHHVNERFFKQVEKTDYCWIWKACIDIDGYGRFSDKAHNIRTAHRYSYFFHHGDIPHGMLVCHKCDNPICVNPDHLFIGSSKDNSNDMKAKNRAAKGQRHGSCTKPEKINRGNTHGMSKLIESDIPKIRNLIENKKTLREVANEFNVSRSSIHRIVKQLTWKHVS
jgi:hypothetical protein